MDFKEEIRLTLMNKTKPKKLLSRLRRVHRREQGLNLALGLLALCNWIGILFFVGFAIDWYVHLPAFIRIIVTSKIKNYEKDFIITDFRLVCKCSFGTKHKHY